MKKQKTKSQPQQLPKKEKASTSPFLSVKMRNNLILGLLLFFTFLLFARGINYSFINYDDPSYITENALIRNLSFEGLIDIFKTPVLGMYNPIPFVVYALIYKFHGMDPSAFHLIGILMHLLATCLVYRFMIRLTDRFAIAIIVAALFALHPTHVSVALWVSQLKTSLYSIFYLMALIEYIRYIKSGQKIKYMVYAMLWFIPALFSKPSAVTLAPMLFVIDYYFQRKWSLRLVFEKTGFGLMAVGLGLTTIFTHKAVGDSIFELSHSYRFIDSIAVSNYGLIFYLEKLFYPMNLSSVYAYPDPDSFLPIKYYLFLGVVPLIAWLTLKAGTFRKEMIFGILFFFVSISVVLRIVPSGDFGSANRYTYMAFNGLFYIIAQFVVYVNEGRIRVPAFIKQYIWIILIGYLFFFTMRTDTRIQVWKNSITLFEDVIKKQPDLPMAYNQLAVAKRNMGDYPGAEKALLKAIELDSGYIDGFSNLSMLYYEMRKLDKAMYAAKRALVARPNSAILNNVIGGIYLAEGNTLDALKYFNLAIKCDSSYKEAYYNRAFIKEASGDKKGAEADLSRASGLGMKEANDALVRMTLETT